MLTSKQRFYVRTALLALVVVGLCGLFLFLTYDLSVNQQIEAEEATAINTYYTSKTIQAARGDITDRYGNVLVTNKAEYVVTVDVDSMGDVDEQVENVNKLLDICDTLGVDWNDEEFPVSNNSPYEFVTTKDGKEKTVSDISEMYVSVSEDGSKSDTRLKKLCDKIYEETEVFWGDSGTSASDLVQNMYRYFGLNSKNYTETRKRQILGVLYSAYLRWAGSDNQQIIWTEYYFAENVDIDLITAVEQYNLDGITIDSVSVRDYRTKYAAHLLGQVGSISAEKWAELNADPKTNTYNMNDSIGLSGVESAFEKYLKGIDGTERTIYDLSGRVLGKSYPTEPQVGNNVVLTLDIGLQEAAEKALAQYTDELNDGNGGSAVVVLSADDSSVLAAASYPTFDASTYTEDYESLVADERMPLYNRAFLGIYAPGSTYKICTGTAAISSGSIKISQTINCTGSYNNNGTIQSCWRKSGHGEENLADAIRDSCNVYFYTVGKKMGITYLNEVAQGYGLGVASGIELTENTGVNAGPEHSESIGSIWYGGNVTSAAIGQSDNQFTILQIANYIAAFCRGGKRYDAHLLKNVKSNDNSDIIYEHETNELSTVELSTKTQAAITEGMGEVIAADNITFFQTLENSGIKVACKTGTAQLGTTKVNNGLFVAFAPIDDPQIIVCTVVEKAKSDGASTSVITSDIMNYYFSEEATLERVESENQLLR